jgi:hypothetical protein
MRCVLEKVGRNTEQELANGLRKEHANVDAHAATTAATLQVEIRDANAMHLGRRQAVAG